jgi:hypothetical protein
LSCSMAPAMDEAVHRRPSHAWILCGANKQSAPATGIHSQGPSNPTAARDIDVAAKPVAFNGKTSCRY